MKRAKTKLVARFHRDYSKYLERHLTFDEDSTTAEYYEAIANFREAKRTFIFVIDHSKAFC